MAVGIIPARLGSTRLPEKALCLVAGKPLICHVLENARKAARLERVVVATDAEAIAAAVRSIGGEAVMTDPAHPSGTDRIAEVARKIGGSDDDIIVNVQGDEPDIDPATIDRVAESLEKNRDIEMSTAATAITTIAEYRSPNRVKVVVDDRGRALYFSRSPIPYWRGDGSDRELAEKLASGIVLLHLGIYGFRRRSLIDFVERPPAVLEQWEKLEQLRALAAGFKIAVVKVAASPPGIDTPEDLEAFRRRIER